jgi:hypothetical protein
MVLTVSTPVAPSPPRITAISGSTSEAGVILAGLYGRLLSNMMNLLLIKTCQKPFGRWFINIYQLY